MFERVLPDGGENPLIFDDEYISTGGQLYEILVGHDRFLADLRPLFFEALGLPPKLTCHPYDICTELIAREAGVIVTARTARRFRPRSDIRAHVAPATPTKRCAPVSSRIFRNYLRTSPPCPLS